MKTAYHIKLTITGVSRGQAKRIEKWILSAVEAIKQHAIEPVDIGLVVTEEDFDELNPAEYEEEVENV